jgi:hypothetical protein
VFIPKYDYSTRVFEVIVRLYTQVHLGNLRIGGACPCIYPSAPSQQFSHLRRLLVYIPNCAEPTLVFATGAHLRRAVATKKRVTRNEK